MLCGHCIPSNIAERSRGSFDKRGKVVPSGGSAVRSVSVAYTCVAGAIGSLIACAGIVDPADGKVLRDSALYRHARAQIPAPNSVLAAEFWIFKSLPLPAGSS